MSETVHQFGRRVGERFASELANNSGAFSYTRGRERAEFIEHVVSGHERAAAHEADDWCREYSVGFLSAIPHLRGEISQEVNS